MTGRIRARSTLSGVTPPYDVQELRRRFPALSRVVDGLPAVYLDGPAGTQVPEMVIDSVGEALVMAASNVGGSFQASHDSEAVVATARGAGADLVGGDPSEIVFGPNMTTLTFSISRAMAVDWSEGDNVVLSRLDHDANIAPWVRAANDRGVEVRFARLRPDDVSLDLEHLEDLLDGRTRLVAVTGCSNAFGSLVDVPRVAEAARRVGARSYVDAVHLAAHERIDVASLGCDLVVCSAYKFFGPHVGVLWGRTDVLDQIDAYKVRPAPDRPPGRFETGTPSFPLLAGVAAAVDHLASIGGGPDRVARLDDAFARTSAHEATLGERFLAGLPAGVRVWGPQTMEGRVSTFSISVPGRTAGDAAAELGRRGIFTWAGHHYAVEPMAALGVLESGGLLRIGLGATTTEAEVDRTLAVLHELAG
jgi:cysteine desulfurase family protein (TIGR01976 family)